MKDASALLAAWNIDEMRGQILDGVRIVACVVGAGLGWFLASPLFRLTYRLFSPRRGIPGGLLVPLRLMSAAGVAAAVYFYLPLGFGGGGGFGSGGGTGDGTGPGTGNGTGNATGISSADPSNKSIAKKNQLVGRKEREEVEIQLVPDKNDDEKFYLVKRKGLEDARLNFKEVEQLIVANKDTFDVDITFSGRDAPGPESGAVIDLRDMLKKQGVHVRVIGG